MKLEDYTIKDLRAEIVRREREQLEALNYQKARAALTKLTPDGIWKVSTEGDEEGRSTKNFGTFEGNFADLALQYGRAAFYKLDIEPALHLPDAQLNPAKEAHVTATGLLGWGGDNAISEGQCKAIEEWLGGKYSVRPSNYFKSVVISRKDGV
jgi:hypothetical protein